MSEISCKHCGSCSYNTVEGRGPHAYEMKCADCFRHIKWVSAVEVEKPSAEEAAAKIKEFEWAAIRSAQKGNFADFMSYTKKIDKYLEVVS